MSSLKKKLKISFYFEGFVFLMKTRDLPNMWNSSGLPPLLPVEVRHDAKTPLNSCPLGHANLISPVCMFICVCICAVFVFIYSTDGYVTFLNRHSGLCACLCFSVGFMCMFPCLIVRVLPLALSQVTGVSVSPGKDQLVVFHTKDSRDLVVCLQGMVPANESRIGELVGTLLSHFKR